MFTVSPVAVPNTLLTDIGQIVNDILAAIGKAGLTSEVAALEAVFGAIFPFVPGLAAIGKEDQRETTLKALLIANDLAGLQAFDADEPAHPDGSRAICRLFEAMVTARIAAGVPAGTPVSP